MLVGRVCASSRSRLTVAFRKTCDCWAQGQVQSACSSDLQDFRLQGGSWVGITLAVHGVCVEQQGREELWCRLPGKGLHGCCGVTSVTGAAAAEWV